MEDTILIIKKIKYIRRKRNIANSFKTIKDINGSPYFSVNYLKKIFLSGK